MNRVGAFAACGGFSTGGRGSVTRSTTCGGPYGRVPRLLRGRPDANLAKRATVFGTVHTRTVASSALPEPTDIMLDAGGGFKKTVFVDNDDLREVLRIKGVIGLEEVETGKVVNNIKLLKRDGMYKIEVPKEKPQPVTVRIDELDGRGPAEITFDSEDEFQSYLKQNKVKRLEAGQGDGLKIVLKLLDVAEGGEYRFPAFKAKSQPKKIKVHERGVSKVLTFKNEGKYNAYLAGADVAGLVVRGSDSQDCICDLSDLDESKEYCWPKDPRKEPPPPVTIRIDELDGQGPVPMTFPNESSFRSYLKETSVGRLEVVGLGQVKRTREFSELDPNKMYRWPEDPWSSSLGKQVAMLEGGLSNLDNVFIMKLARFLSTRLSSEFGELDVQIGVKFLWGPKTLDVDVLLVSKDMRHMVLVEAKRTASEGVIAQQEQTMEGYKAVFNIQQDTKIHPIVAAQLWEDGAKDAVLAKGWWAVSDVSGNFDLEKPQGPA